MYLKRLRHRNIYVYNHIFSVSTLGLVPYKGELLIVRSSLVEVDQVCTTLNAWWSALWEVLFCYNICYQGMCWYTKFQQDIQIYTLLLRALSTINMRIATCMDRCSMIYGQKTGTCDRHFLLFLTADGSKRMSETSPECLRCLKHVVRRRPAEHVMWWCPCPWTKDRGWRELTTENNYKVENQKGWLMAAMILDEIHPPHGQNFSLGTAFVRFETSCPLWIFHLLIGRASPQMLLYKALVPGSTATHATRSPLSSRII